VFLPEELRSRAASQRSVFSLSQARDSGMTQDMLDDRRRAGDLWSPHRGVFAVSAAPRTWEQSVVAACLAGGRGTVGSFRAGVHHWELLEMVDPPVEITIPRARSPRFGRGTVIIHRQLDLKPRHCTVRRGVPVTNPLRTVLDAAGVLSDEQMQAVLDAGIAQRLFAMRAVDAERARTAKPGKNGTGKLKALLDRQVLRDAERTVLEAHMARLWQRFALPAYEFQHVIRSPDGRFLGRPDFVIVEPKVIIEVNGWATHSSPTATDEDARRAHRLLANGWLILTFSWYRVRFESAAVAAEIRDVVSARLVA